MNSGILFAALVACAPAAPKADAAKNDATVTLTARNGDAVRVRVEIANTPEQREQGLMYRQKLDDSAGMLFLFPRQDRVSFWMKNTLIPLDMVFIRSDMSVAGIVENAEPLTLTSRAVEAPSQYVLEVNGGFCVKNGVVAGSRVRFDHVPAAPKQ